MIPELKPEDSLLLINREADDKKQYPFEKDAGELVNLPSFIPTIPWHMIASVKPYEVRVGDVGGRDHVPVGYQKWILGVDLPYIDRWPDELDADRIDELPFALLQKQQNVLVAYVFMGRVAAISAKLHKDRWTALIVLHVARVKRLTDRVI